MRGMPFLFVDFWRWFDSTFGVLESTFCILESTFGVLESTFCFEVSTFCFEVSTRCPLNCLLVLFFITLHRNREKTALFC